MEYELTCCICLELYEDPVLLPCSHNLCKSCVVSLASCEKSNRGSVSNSLSGVSRTRHRSCKVNGNDGDLKLFHFLCPSCRYEIRIDDLSDLPRNKTLDNIVKIYKYENKEIKKKDHHIRHIQRQRSQDEMLNNCFELHDFQQRIAHVLHDLESLMMQIQDHGKILRKSAEACVQQLIDRVHAKKEESLNMLQKRLVACEDPVRSLASRLVHIRDESLQLSSDCQHTRVEMDSSFNKVRVQTLNDRVSSFMEKYNTSSVLTTPEVALPDWHFDIGEALLGLQMISWKSNSEDGKCMYRNDLCKKESSSDQIVDSTTTDMKGNICDVPVVSVPPVDASRAARNRTQTDHQFKKPKETLVQSDQASCTLSSQGRPPIAKSTSFGMDLNLKFNFSSPSVPSPSLRRQSPSPAKHNHRARSRGGLTPRSLFKTTKAT